MNTETNGMKLMVLQETLDQLFSEHLIPSKLTALTVNDNGLGEYEAPLSDGGKHSFRFSWKDGASFKEVIRAAVLDRARRMTDPLNAWVM